MWYNSKEGSLPDLKLTIDNAITKIEFTEQENKAIKKQVEAVLHEKLGIKKDGYMFLPSYKNGYFDGITDFYDKNTQTFPSGLVEEVDQILGKLQDTVPFIYEFDDNRPDKFINTDDIPEHVTLFDGKGGELTLRDYQMDSLRSIFDSRMGLLNVSVGGGKCLTPDTLLSTGNGLMTVTDLFKEQGYTMDNKESVVEYTGSTSLINRYGELEKPSHLTFNGSRPTLKVTTEYGLEPNVTENHPLLTVNSEGKHVWKEAKDLVVGDLLVGIYGLGTFGNAKTTMATAHTLGLKAGTGKDKSIHRCILSGTKAIQIRYLLSFFKTVKVLYNHDNFSVRIKEQEFLRQLYLVLLNLGICSKLDLHSGIITFNQKNLSDLLSYLENGTLFEGYFHQRITEIEVCEATPTFDVAMPETHSFIANGIVNHNTEIAGGIIKTILPKLERGETIAFFTTSKEIFNQTANRLEERLNIPIGRYGAGKKVIKQVNVVMIPTISAALKVDPEKGLKLTPKERLTKRIVKEIVPRFTKGTNQRQLLLTYLKNFQPKTKTDLTFVQEIESIVYTCGTNKEVVMALNGYTVKYNKLLEKKNAKVLKKKRDVTEFLDSIVAFISDEHQHVTADSLYNSILACHNAIYRVGLSGSIDLKNKFLVRRLKATTGATTAKVSSDLLIERGLLAKPTIIMTPIHRVEYQNQTIDITKTKDYMTAYTQGIVKNDFRNSVIAKLVEMCYNDGKGILVIVSRIEHGDTISASLEASGVKHSFLRGDVEDEIRDRELTAMRSGELKVVIATSIMDEGVDISGIDVLVMAAGGKSLRQTVQRVGRAIRKKEGDNTAKVYDFLDRTNEYLYKHAKERIKIYEQEQFEIHRIQ